MCKMEKKFAHTDVDALKLWIVEKKRVKKKLPSQYFTHLLPRGILQSSTMRGKYMIS